jgi:hypothetical protein
MVEQVPRYTHLLPPAAHRSHHGGTEARHQLRLVRSRSSKETNKRPGRAAEWSRQLVAAPSLNTTISVWQLSWDKLQAFLRNPCSLLHGLGRNCWFRSAQQSRSHVRRQEIVFDTHLNLIEISTYMYTVRNLASDAGDVIHLRFQWTPEGSCELRAQPTPLTWKSRLRESWTSRSERPVSVKWVELCAKNTGISIP